MSKIVDREGLKAFRERLDDKYVIEGEFSPNTSVGNAEQLISTIFVNDKVPYLFRTSGGDADIGNREYDKIVGGSLVVNQQIQNGNFESVTGWSNIYSSFSVSNNIATFTASGQYGRITHQLTPIKGRKYLIKCDIKLTTGTTSVKIAFAGSDSIARQAKATENTTNWQTLFKVVDYLSDASYTFTQLWIYDERTENRDAIQVKNVNVIDLTQMFGSTIANYIYSLEQAQSGSGVAWFRNYFQETYYPYNTGEIKNVKLISHDMVGFNQFNKEDAIDGYIDNDGTQTSASGKSNSNFIRIFPNTTYYGINLRGAYDGSRDICYYDANKNFVSYASLGSTTKYTGTFTTPTNAYYMRVNFFTEDKDTVCINLSWSGWRNGQYEPYVNNSYPLDTSIELRGIPKLDGNNNLYFDGDEYSSDGKVVRKYRIVDLGTLSWSRIGTDVSGQYRFNAVLPQSAKQSDITVGVSSLCSKYSPLESGGTYASAKTGYTISSTSEVLIRDAAYNSLSAAEFKTAMSGVYLVYELATPTEETADTFQEPQIVDDFGTEQYVVPTQDSWQIPVGHDTKYPANLRDKLQRLPDMPSVSQNVTETYVVNYNGTTKKCSFVEIDTWLGSNGYVKQEDLSSGITNILTGVSLIIKKVIKTGNTITLSICAYNESAGDISANTTLFVMPPNTYNTDYSILTPCVISGNLTFARIIYNQSGAVNVNSTFGSGQTLFINVSYSL